MAKRTRAASKAAKPYHHGDLREALIRAGLALLAETGDPAAVGLREAARRVGVSQAAPYAHFRDKRDMLAAIAERGFLMFADSMRRAAGAFGPGDARLAGLAQGYVTFALKHPALYRLMFGPGLAKADGAPGLAEAQNAAFAVLLESFGGDPAAPETQAAGLAAWSFAHGLALLVMDKRVPQDALGTTDLADIVAATTRWIRFERPSRDDAPATPRRSRRARSLV